MSVATKYEVDSVCKAVVSHLEQAWPRTLAELIRLEYDTRRVEEGFCGLDERTRYIRKRSDLLEPAIAIRLATDFDIPSILPAAYYMLTTMYVPDELASRCERYLLGDSEMLRYYKGKYELADLRPEVECIYQAVGYTKDCTNAPLAGTESDCTKTSNRIYDESMPLWKASLELQCADPLKRLIELYDKGLDETLCAGCKAFVRMQAQYEMKDIWNSLSKIFNLSSQRTWSSNIVRLPLAHA